jgi:hypothetical protein
MLVLLLAGLAAALAWAGGGLGRAREVLGSGATEAATGSGLTLRGTLGQPVVGEVRDSGGRVTLGQGFWHGDAPSGAVYLPLVSRQ